jgi:subtilisin family serine protease
VKAVIVKLKGVDAVTATSGSGRATQVAEIKSASLSLDAIGGGYIEKIRDYTNLPYAVYVVDAAGEAALKADGRVEGVSDDRQMKQLADTPISTIGGSAQTGFSDGSNNYTGNGYAVAVVDSGVDKNHPALAGKVVAEACFGMNHTYTNAIVESLCPGGAESSTATDSALPCSLAGCGHGTEVAGAAAMSSVDVDIDGDSTADHLSGTAKDAKIVAIQVNSKVTETSATIDLCGDGLSTLSTCTYLDESVYLAGLDYVATLSLSTPIAAANLSIGGGPFASTTSECAETAYDAVAVTLRAHNIAPIVAAGNSGDNASYYDKIASPACASGAIAVAATNVKGTALASYSNNGPLTDLLAPGGDWDGTNDDSMLVLPKSGATTYVLEQGTSFAAPMVAGAYAVLREAHPSATVDQLTALLQNTGTSVNDARSGYTVGAKKLIQLDAALAAAEDPIISTFTGPSGTINENSTITLHLAGANATSCSLNNGVGSVAVTSTASTKDVPAKASYTLTCVGTYGDSVSQTLNFTVNAAPTQPANIAGNGSQSARTFLVSWDASTDSNNVANYLVYVNGNLVATLEASARSYLISNVQFGQAYSVDIRAVDTLGASSLAANVGFTLTADGVTTTSVPNTGIHALEVVQVWQVIVFVGGAVMVIMMLTRRHPQVTTRSKK